MIEDANRKCLLCDDDLPAWSARSVCYKHPSGNLDHRPDETSPAAGGSVAGRGDEARGHQSATTDPAHASDKASLIRAADKHKAHLIECVARTALKELLSELEVEFGPHRVRATWPQMYVLIADAAEELCLDCGTVGTEHAPGCVNERPTLLSPNAREEALRDARAMSAEMAEDAGLWFVPQTAAEAYLQDALRKLCALIEGVTPEECAIRALLSTSSGE